MQRATEQKSFESRRSFLSMYTRTESSKSPSRIRVCEAPCTECGKGKLTIRYQNWMSFYVVACDNPRCSENIVPKKFQTNEQAEDYLHAELKKGAPREVSRAAIIRERAEKLSPPLTTSLREVLSEVRSERERRELLEGNKTGGEVMAETAGKTRLADFFEVSDVPLPGRSKEVDGYAELRDAVEKLQVGKCILQPIDGLDEKEVRKIVNRFNGLRIACGNLTRRYAVRKVWVERNGETVKCAGIWRI